MWVDWGIYLVPCVIMLAACTRSTFGFGDALLGMPLLLALISPESAVVVMASMSLIQGVVMLWQERAEVDFRVSFWLMGAALLGVPFGLWSVQVLPANLLRFGVGVLVLAYATQALFKIQLPTLRHRVWSVGAGFLSGFLGAAVNISGPPVVLYGTMARWSPEKFRATLQGFFLPLGVVIVAGQLLSGMWTPSRLGMAMMCVPALCMGAWVGTRCRGRISPVLFFRALHILLVIMGAMLAYGALRQGL